jgi:hypothetical protein
VTLARVLAACDGVAEAINAVWMPVPPDVCRRSYGEEIDADRLDGRRVLVMPTSARWAEQITRAAGLHENGVSVLVVERYAQAGKPIEEWMDERVAWVQDLLDLFDNARYPRALADFYPQGTNVEPVYDQEEYLSRKLFVSVLQLTLRGQE